MKLAAVCLALGAVLSAGTASATVVVGKEECGKAVTLEPGERLEVVLHGQPAAGFLWLARPPVPAFLTQEKERPFKRDSNRAGAGGLFTLGFVAGEAGEGELALVYRRPWEEQLPPAATCSYTIRVGKVAEQAAAVYVSPAGKRMEARFDLAARTVTVTLPDGRRVALPVAVSGSGARYSNGKETFWEHQGAGRFFTGDKLVFEGTVGGEKPAAPVVGMAGEWYEKEYLQRLQETRSPCRSILKYGAPRITVRAEGDELVARVEYRLHDPVPVRLGKVGDKGGNITVRHDPEHPEVEEKLVWRGGESPFLALVRLEPVGKGAAGQGGKKKEKVRRMVAHYRQVQREELNRMVIAGEYRDLSGGAEQVVSITPQGRFQGGSLRFGYELGLDCNNAACNYLQSTDGNGDAKGVPARYGFRLRGNELLILPIRYEGDGRLVCGPEPLLRLESKETPVP